MIYSSYGRTGKRVSRLGFGGMRFAPADLQDEAGLEGCAEVVRHALRAGVNYFDTAPLYAGGKGEAIFGWAFQGVKTPFYVSTKTALAQDRTADAVRKRIEASLAALRIEKIAFYQMWTIMDLSHYRHVMTPHGPYDGALKAKQEGLIEHIGFSTHCCPDDIITIIKEGRFECLTISFNAINCGAMRRVVEEAAARNMGIATMNSLGGGLIPKHPAYFQSILHPQDLDVSEAALWFNASVPGVSVVLSGMTSIAEVDANVAALDNESAIDPRRVLTVKAPAVSDAPPLCTGCGYCRDCPADIPISDYMQAYNYTFFPSDELMGQSLAWMDAERQTTTQVLYRLRASQGVIPESDESPCTHCGHCERVCTQHIPICNRLQDVHARAARHDYTVPRMRRRLKDLFTVAAGTAIGIYPAGAYTEALLLFYRRYVGSLPAPLYVFDSNAALWGTSVCDRPIRAPADIPALGIRRMVITHIRHHESIRKSLLPYEAQGVELLKLHTDTDIVWF